MVKEIVVSGEVPVRKVPMVFDLDGTLHLGDVMMDALGYTWRQEQRLFWRLIWAWMWGGRTRIKLLAEQELRGRWWPEFVWDTRVVELLRGMALGGRPVVIATGSPEGLVKDLLSRALWTAGLELEIMGTRELEVNLTAENKAAALVERFGEKGFDYAGNSRDDLAVWQHARHAVVVNASPAVAAAARQLGNVVQEFPPEVRA